jgi:integrase
MPKLVHKKVKVVTIEGVCVIRYKKQFDKWELDAGLKLGGTKKYRKRFNSLDEAKVHAEQIKIKLKNQGVGGFKLTREQLVDAEKALLLLNDTKFTTLTEAIGFVQRFASDKQSDITVRELVDQFRERKEEEAAQNLRGTSKATLAEYRYRHGLLSECFGHILVREFTEDNFKPLFALKKFSPQLLSKTKTLFNFAVKEGLIPQNPIKIEPPKKKATEPKIFEDDAWRRLILNAIHRDEYRLSKGEPIQLLAYVTLGLWCGLRPKAELERLQWEDVHLDDDNPSVFIHADWKVKHGRWVSIPPCAVALLKQCKDRKGFVTKPKNLRRRLDFLKEDSRVKDSWSADIMRHTFASMHYGFYGDKNAIANQLGHVSHGVLDHYINNGKKNKSRAQEFFSFTAPLPNSASELIELTA